MQQMGVDYARYSLAALLLVVVLLLPLSTRGRSFNVPTPPTPDQRCPQGTAVAALPAESATLTATLQPNYAPSSARPILHKGRLWQLAAFDRSPEQPDALNRWLARAYTVNWELVAYIAIFVLAIITRFVNLGVRVMSHDESLHTYYSWRLATLGDFQHSPLMHGPILFHVTALFYSLFGDTDFTSRLYPAILGVVLTMTPLLFRRWIGRMGRAAGVGHAAGVAAADVLQALHPRRHAVDFVGGADGLRHLHVPGRSAEHLRRRARWLYLVAGMMLWNLGSKETAFIYIAIFGSFLGLYWLVRLYQAWRRKPSRRLFHFLIVTVLIGGAGGAGDVHGLQHRAVERGDA